MYAEQIIDCYETSENILILLISILLVIMDYSKSYKKYKKRYLHLKKYQGYKRTSLLLFETDGKELNVILFRNKRWQAYSDTGGRISSINTKNPLMLNIIKETKEETLNSLNIQQLFGTDQEPFYIDMKDGKDKVRIYVLVIQKGIYDQTIFFENKDLLSERKVPHDWDEIDNVKIFKLKDLLACKKGTEVMCKGYKIYGRVLKYLRFVNSQNVLDKAIQRPVHNFKIYRINNPSMLRDTRSINLLPD